MTLLKLYRTHVRSKLDFGCVVYGSARPSALESLDRVQNAALRTCLGAFRTSPIPSLHVEAGEMPLNLRRQQLSLQYIVKLRSNPSDPAFHCVFSSGFSRLFEARPNIIATLGHRLQQNLLDSGINLNNIAKHPTPQFPTWILISTSISAHARYHLAASQKSLQPCMKLGSTSYYLTMIITRGYSQMDRRLGKRLVLLPS